MNIVVTYGEAEIIKMVQKRLAKRGIDALPENIVFKKNMVIITVNDVTDDDDDIVDDVVSSPPALPVRVQPEPPPRAPRAAPQLESIDGGEATSDMSGVFAASKRLAASTEGKFPTPKHAMLEGESSEFPYPEK